LPNKLNFKASAFADDVTIVCMKTTKAIYEIFWEYERLTNRSGLELNADKTEILVMNTNRTEKVKFQYLGKQFEINTVN